MFENIAKLKKYTKWFLQSLEDKKLKNIEIHTQIKKFV